MPFQSKHLTDAPDRSTVDTLPGATLLEFGTAWCGHCQGAQPLIAQALDVDLHPSVGAQLLAEVVGLGVVGRNVENARQDVEVCAFQTAGTR